MTGHDLARDQTPITAILEKQRSAFLREGAPGLAQRQADLIKLKNALLARRRAFEAAAPTLKLEPMAIALRARRTTLARISPSSQVVNLGIDGGQFSRSSAKTFQMRLMRGSLTSSHR
jgi:hypothetical protein